MRILHFGASSHAILGYVVSQVFGSSGYSSGPFCIGFECIARIAIITPIPKHHLVLKVVGVTQFLPWFSSCIFWRLTHWVRTKRVGGDVESSNFESKKQKGRGTGFCSTICSGQVSDVEGDDL